MLTYPWKCTVLHCNHLGNTWKPLVLMTRHFDYCPSASEGDNQSVRSSAPVVSRCFAGGYNVKLYIFRGRLAWWLLAFLCCGYECIPEYKTNLKRQNINKSDRITNKFLQRLGVISSKFCRRIIVCKILIHPVLIRCIVTYNYCKSTNVGVVLYLANLGNCVFSLIFVEPTSVNYVDRTLHRRGDAKFNSRQITLF